MTEEWTDWIEHDGKGCPCVGKFAHVVTDDGREHFCIATMDGRSWNALYLKSHAQIIRYRIRKPRALQELIELAENLPEEVDA